MPMPLGLTPPRRVAPLKGLLVLCLALLTASAWASRLALVIGNRDYTTGALKNPINDAVDVGNALGALGFQVTLVKNIRRDDVGPVVEGFTSRIRAGDDVVVFYAGHGVQVKGVNYLPAVDANIRVESDVALNSINLNQLLDRLDDAHAGVRLLLIDACRDNPYARSFRSGTRGLARVEGAPSGTLMHFATRPGGVAADGDGRNGLYTANLLKNLRTPGLPVESMLKRVAVGVKQESGGEQQPWTEGALDGEFYFVPDREGRAQASINTQPASPASPPAPVRPAQSSSGQTLKYCDQCPELTAIPAGQFLMGAAASDAAAKASERPQRSMTLARPFALGVHEVTVGQFRAFVEATSYKGTSLLTPFRRALDESCRTYVVNEHVKGWGEIKGANWLKPGFPQTDDHPVVCVSASDAQAYVEWLSERSGHAFRLPSEAEWEYAARAGSTGTYPWGNDAKAGDARCVGCAEGKVGTRPARSGAPNLFGLFGMIGNAAEFCSDWWTDSLADLSPDGRPYQPLLGNSATAVIRGGGWGYSHEDSRLSSRLPLAGLLRSAAVGFRVAADL